MKLWRLRHCLTAMVWLAAAPGAAFAQDIHFSGLLDFRVLAPSGQVSNFDGGVGKFRWGDRRGSPVTADLGAAILRGSLTLTPEIRAVAEIRYDPRQKTAVDVIDAYVRWRPVSTSRWRWSVKAGAFFVPISLENTGIGWTPEWTVTPSVINSWAGQELRTIGAEGMLEWRGDTDRIEIVASAFALNEPAGTAVEAFGWTFNDRPTGLLDHLRLPNFMADPGGKAYTYITRQFDHTAGWYAGITWERPDIGRLSLLYYDNGADTAAHDSTQFGWRTKFWSFGASTELGPVVLLAQAMMGTTAISAGDDDTSMTDFWAYYVLAGIERGDWRFALRFDQFCIRENQSSPGIPGDERGIAGTAAITWSAAKGIKLIGEVIATDYTRPQRVLIGRPPHATEVQAQIALRLSF